MRKTKGRMTAILLSICMLASMVLTMEMTVFADDSAGNDTGQAGRAAVLHNPHCICGGSVNTGGHSCSASPEWKPLNLNDTAAWINGYQTQVSASYYLTEDIILSWYATYRQLLAQKSA